MANFDKNIEQLFESLVLLEAINVELSNAAEKYFEDGEGLEKMLKLSNEYNLAAVQVMNLKKIVFSSQQEGHRQNNFEYLN